MNYDKILEHIGEGGIWHWVNYFLISLPNAVAGVFVLTFAFSGLPPPAFRCHIPECDDDEGVNSTFADFNSSIFPSKCDPLGGCTTDYCSHYPVRGSRNETSWDNEESEMKRKKNKLSLPCPRSLQVCQLSDFDLTAHPVSCPSSSPFYYSPFDMSNSVVTEFDLVCGDEFKVALIGSVYMTGQFASSFTFGPLADVIGRRHALAIAVALGCTGSLAGSFAQSFAWYAVSRFFAAMGGLGMFMITFLLAVELAGDRTKTFIGNLFQCPWAIGESLVCLLAYLIRDWRTFQIVSSAPFYLVLLIWFFIPESPRWLIATKRYGQARATLEKAARMNGVKIPEELLEVGKAERDEEEQVDENSNAASSSDLKVTNNSKNNNNNNNRGDSEPLGLLSLFSRPRIARNTVIMAANWIVVPLGYYGISMSVGNLGTDIFVTLLLLSLLEVPSYIACYLLMDHTGRKPLFAGALCLTGVGCVIAAFMEEGTGKTVMALVGKFGASASFSIVYLFTAELYPTKIRSTALGFCSTCAGIGGISAPQVALYLPSLTFPAFPLLLMGVCSLAGALLSLLLPETLGSPLLETLDQVDQLGRDAKPFFSWWSKERLREHMERQQQQRGSLEGLTISSAEKK